MCGWCSVVVSVNMKIPCVINVRVVNGTVLEMRVTVVYISIGDLQMRVW